MSAPTECPDICTKQAAAQLLGPLRPNACVCAHGVRRTIDDVFPAHAPHHTREVS